MGRRYDAFVSDRLRRRERRPTMLCTNKRRQKGKGSARESRPQVSSGQMVGQTYRITAVGLAAASLESTRLVDEMQSTGCIRKYIVAVCWPSDYETTRRASN
jgi:hypothetical protein